MGSRPLSRRLRIFLCHATEDKPKVIELYNLLKSEDWIDPWLDVAKLLPGQDWDFEINKAIHAADLIIVCFSKISTKKEGYVQREIKRATDIAEEKPKGTIYISPLRFDTSELPLDFKRFQWADYFVDNGHEKLLQSLRLKANEISKSEEENSYEEFAAHDFASSHIDELEIEQYSHFEREYSRDLWDYLVDIPYMPSRTDRDKLLKHVDKKRVKIWDYFFRIKPEEVGKPQQQEISLLMKALKDNSKQTDNKNKQLIIKRVRELELELENLRSQIPSPPLYETIREWLNEDLSLLSERSKEASGLSNRLIQMELNNEKISNPITLLGPAELQKPGKIPPTLHKINSDLKKHLFVKRAYQSQENWIDVLYAVYYLEYILITDDLMVTYELFYDFITGKSYGVRQTEQYYKDVVGLAINSEFRQIYIGENGTKPVYIEDAPTLTLSLASGEQHTITFANENYFLEIRDKIEVAEEDISRIFLIHNSQKSADAAIKALRFRLRLHKSLDNHEE